MSIAAAGEAGEMLDSRARQNYKHRLLELREQLEELRERGDHQGASDVESEIDFLAHELARALD